MISKLIQNIFGKKRDRVQESHYEWILDRHDSFSSYMRIADQFLNKVVIEENVRISPTTNMIFDSITPQSIIKYYGEPLISSSFTDEGKFIDIFYYKYLFDNRYRVKVDIHFIDNWAAYSRFMFSDHVNMSTDRYRKWVLKRYGIGVDFDENSEVLRGLEGNEMCFISYPQFTVEFLSAKFISKFR